MKILTSHCCALAVEGSQSVTRTGGTNLQCCSFCSSHQQLQRCILIGARVLDIDQLFTREVSHIQQRASGTHGWAVKPPQRQACWAAAPVALQPFASRSTLCTFNLNSTCLASILTMTTAVTCLFFSQPVGFLPMSTCRSESRVSWDALSHCGQNRKRNLVLTNKQSQGCDYNLFRRSLKGFYPKLRLVSTNCFCTIIKEKTQQHNNTNTSNDGMSPECSTSATAEREPPLWPHSRPC